MNARLQTIQTQKQILAPSMQQSIEVLLLPLAELTTAIEQEIQENPLLEVNEEKTSELSSLDEALYKNLRSVMDAQRIPTQKWEYNEDDERSESAPISRQATLEEHLIHQLHFELDEPDDIAIGEFIVGNLNDDGYLTCTPEFIAGHFNLPDTTRVEAIRAIIQHFDPLGVASLNIQECLILQIDTKYNGTGDLLRAVIRNHFDDLGNKKFAKIAQALKISIDEVKNLVKAIAELEPRPARNWRPLAANLYIKPDIIVTENATGEYHVSVNKKEIPYLRISPTYKNLLKQNGLTADASQFIREKMRNALLFIRSIEQRNTTIKRIAQYILEQQKEFFKHGHMAIKPMTLKDVAQAIGRNESTISRAINNKYIDTPRGLIALKFFFSQGLTDEQHGEVASRSIQEEIKSLIEEEDKNKPLSDHRIEQYFKQKGMHIARRTISKYRHGLNILPSHLRKE